MFFLILRSWFLLIRLANAVRAGGFNALYGIVRNEPALPRPYVQTVACEKICRAVDLACAFSFKPVSCLQRSAVITILLKRQGKSAQMVIGAQILPFKSHAWVELDGAVVNDRPYLSEIYRVLERC